MKGRNRGEWLLIVVGVVALAAQIDLTVKQLINR